MGEADLRRAFDDRDVDRRDGGSATGGALTLGAGGTMCAGRLGDGSPEPAHAVSTESIATAVMTTRIGWSRTTTVSAATGGLAMTAHPDR